MAVFVIIAENKSPAAGGQGLSSGQFPAVIRLWPLLPADLHTYQGNRFFH